MYMVSDLMYAIISFDSWLIEGWEGIYDFISIGRRFLKKPFDFGLLKWLVR